MPCIKTRLFTTSVQSEIFVICWAQSAARFSDRPAFKLKNDAGEYYDVSYPDFQADVYALGTKLIDLGLAGEKIAVIGHNCYEWCTAYLAVTCGVGVVVPIDKELPACDIENILRVSEAAAILFDEKAAQKVLENRSALPPKIRLISLEAGDAQQGILSLRELLAEGPRAIKSRRYTHERSTDRCGGPWLSPFHLRHDRYG